MKISVWKMRKPTHTATVMPHNRCRMPQLRTQKPLNPKRADKPRVHTIEQNSSDKDDGMHIAMINDDADTEEWEVNIRMNRE